MDKKAAFYPGGYGENITFSARKGGRTTEILISVAPKDQPYLLWRTSCEKVAQTVLSAFSKCVQEYIFTDAESASVADETQKFKELLDMGAITQQEYDAKN